MPASVHHAFDADPLDVRLQIIAAMLDKAVSELNGVMAEIRCERLSTEDGAGDGTDGTDRAGRG